MVGLMSFKMRRYIIYYTQSVSGITSSGTLEVKRFRKPNNLKVFGSKTIKVF